MPAKYHIVARGKPGQPAAPKKYYPSAITTGRTNARQLSTRIAEISTLSTIDTLAMLEALLNAIPHELAQGRLVDLGDFGSFRLRLDTDGADSPEKVSSRQIKQVRVRFTPGKVFQALLDNIEFVKE